MITATSGALTHTVNVTLVVNGDFSISVTPASRTIARGGVATYTVTIAGGSGFAGTVSLTVGGLPRFATSKFNPQSLVTGGTSVLTVNTNKNVPIGTSTLTVTGTSGGRVHSANVSLIIQ